MRGSTDAAFRLVLLVAGLGLLVGPGAAVAQTGPGGVGDATGTTAGESLTVWLRSDVGVTTVTGSEAPNSSTEVDLWKDQSGEGHDFEDDEDNYGNAEEKRQPEYTTNALNGKPVLRFNSENEDKKDILANSDSGVLGIVGGDNTVFIVSATREELTGSNNTWFQFRFVNANQSENAGYLGTSEGKVKVDKNGTGPTLNLSSPITDYHVFSSVSDNTTDGQEDLGVDGTVRGTKSSSTTTSSGHLEIGKKGTLAKENFAEFIVFKTALNTAERRLVANYLAEKYGLSMAGNDYYRYGTGHPSEIVGIGRETSSAGASPSGEHTAATSSPLTIEEDTDNSNSLNDGEFVMIGHDGSGASFTTNERPNGNSNVQKVKREWRAEVSGTSQKTVDVEVDYSNLALPGNYNDRAVYVDSDGDFTNGATRHDLDNKSGDIYEASGVPISDGDHVTVAAVKRVVNFSTTSKSVRENVNGTPDLSVQVTTNFPVESNTDIDVITDGDVDDDTGDTDGDPADDPGSGDLQDNGVTNASGSNSNGDYEADGGGGNDGTSGTSCGSCDNDGDGPTNGDYALQSSGDNPSIGSVTISQGGTSATVKVNIDNDDIGTATDGPYEQTEKLEVEFNENGDADGVREGTTTARFVGSIVDDDNPNRIAYTDPNDNDGRTETSSSYNPASQAEQSTTLTYEVALPSGNTGSSSPATEATYEVTGGSATAGSDFKIVDGKDGTRVNATEGTVTIPDADQRGQFEIDVLEDNTYEKDETVTLELTGAQGGTLDGNDKTKITLTISEDDSKPSVEFDSGLFTSLESSNTGFGVSLSASAEVDVDVTFADEGTGSASGSGTDYTFPGDNTITIPAGDTNGTFSFSVNDDTNKETNETIDIKISGATNATVGSPSTSTHEIVDNDVVGSVGPGGVGADQDLAFWLKASGLGLSDGASVGPWPDSSGNGNDAENPVDITCDEPTFVTSGPNGQPALNFDKNGNPDCYSFDEGVVESLPDADYVLFAVSKAGTDVSKQSLLDIQTSGCNSRVLSFRYQNSRKDIAIKNEDGSGSIQTESSQPTGSTLDGSFHIVSAESQDDTLDISFNGKVRSSTKYSSLAGTGSGNTFTGVTCGTQEKMNGKVAEFIAYDRSLNTAQRNIVRNYLSAKYGIGLAGNDLYAGDKSSNGDFDHSVIGVGRDGGSGIAFLHSQAKAGGLTLTTGTVGNGEYVLLGTEATEPSSPVHRMNYQGTSGVSNLTARPDSIWFVDVTNPGAGAPSFDVTFNLTALGFESRSRQPSGYVLLEAGAGSCTPDNNNCSWSDAGGSVTVNGDEVTFSGVSLSSGGHYLAIGTTAPVESPLVNEYARAVDGQAGTDGQDEGWRYVGVPVSGAVIDDLQPPLSSRDGLVGFGQRDVFHWSLDNGGSNDNGWTALGSGDQVPNGRGFIVNLSDDSEHPIDPTLWMDVEPNSGPPGDAGVTVGDASPSYDTQLRTDTTWHLLANPYAVDYDLSGLNLNVDGDSDGNDDFKKGAQVWDPYNSTYNTITQAGDNSDHLAPWEAFFLERNDYSGSGVNTQLTFGKSGRQSTDSESYSGSKSRSAPEGRQIELRLIVRGDDGTERARDEAVGLYFHREAGPGEDAYDLSKLMPGAQDFAALGVVADGRAGTRSLWALHSRSYTPGDTVTVPLALQTDLSGTFSIAAPNWTNVPDDWTATLVDTKGTSTSSDDVTHQLGRDGASPYVFSPGKSTQKNTTSKTTEGASASDEAAPSVPPVRTLRPSRSTAAKTAGSTAKAAAPDSRFRLRVVPSSEALPVEMASMNATVSEQSVRLTWTTTSEQNNAGFYVEHQRLPPGDTTAAPQPGAWTEASFVEGAGTTQEPQDYSTQLQDLDYGRHAFRLRQVDTGGEATYSDIVKTQIRLDGKYDVGTPYPNPATRRATLEVTVQNEQNVRVRMYDLLGRRVRTVYDRTVPGQETKQIRVDTGQLTSGSYFLRIEGDDFVETRRVTVVR